MTLHNHPGAGLHHISWRQTHDLHCSPATNMHQQDVYNTINPEDLKLYHINNIQCKDFFVRQLFHRLCLGNYHCTSKQDQQNMDLIKSENFQFGSSKVFLRVLNRHILYVQSLQSYQAKYGFYWRHYWWRKLVISVKLLLSNIIYNKRDESCRFHSVVIGLPDS